MTVDQAFSRRSLIKRVISDDLGWKHKLGTATDTWTFDIFLLLHWVVDPYIVTLYLMFHLNVQDDNDDVLAYVTKPTLVITRVRMLHFTRQYNVILQIRLKILMSFCSKFIGGYMLTNNYSSIVIFDKVIAKIKLYSFLPHSVHVGYFRRTAIEPVYTFFWWMSWQRFLTIAFEEPDCKFSLQPPFRYKTV